MVSTKPVATVSLGNKPFAGIIVTYIKDLQAKMVHAKLQCKLSSACNSLQANV
jgi:hypothetical protein